MVNDFIDPAWQALAEYFHPTLSLNKATNAIISSKQSGCKRLTKSFMPRDSNWRPQSSSTLLINQMWQHHPWELS